MFKVYKLLYIKLVLLAIALITKERRISLYLFIKSNNNSIVLIINYNYSLARLNL